MPAVNHHILQWARKTAGLTLEQAVRKLGIRDTNTMTGVERLAQLEAGEKAPTRPMLVKMAKQYRRPLLTFYLSNVPRKGDRGQDFRTLPEGHDGSADVFLDVLIRDIRARQGLVRAVMEDEDEAVPLRFINAMTMGDGVDAVLASIRQTIPMTLEEYRRQPTANDAFALLRTRVEQVGIFVLLVGNLGSHHTTIDLTTFRGFALADDVAPFIVLNDQDAKAAWSFSLMHEVAHLWLGQTGVSGAYADVAVEQFCNDVAGEYFVPSSESELSELRIPDHPDVEALQRVITGFASERNVSRSMVAYKLYRRGLLIHDLWQRLSLGFRDEWMAGRDDRRRSAREQEGGPSYYVVRRHRVGGALIGLVERMLSAGALTTTKAGKVLGVKPKNVEPLIEASTAGRPA